MKTPFRARLPARLPTKACISGLPTKEFYRIDMNFSYPRGCCMTKRSFPQEDNFHSITSNIADEFFDFYLILLVVWGYATASQIT